MPYVTQRCSECDGLTHEDRVSGDTVCMDCGLCDRLIIQDDTCYLDVDWSRISVTTKSQHVPEHYMLDLMRKFKTPSELNKLSFVAVAFDNLYLLFDNDCEDWETPEDKKMKRKTRQFQIDNFISDMEYIHVNGSYQSKTDRITVLVADAKKTASQTSVSEVIC